MIDFSKVEKINIPNGECRTISIEGSELWKKKIYSKELEYIESTGTQYIDTKCVPNNKTKLELVASGITADSFSVASGTWFLGGRAGYLNNGFGFYYNPSNKQIYFAFGNNMPSATYTKLYDGIKTIRLEQAGLYINSERIVTPSTSTFTSPVPLALFGLNNNGAAISFTSFRLHSCRIWNADELVRDYIPVLDHNGEACLYDKVTDTLFHNKGTGKFSYG